MEESFTFLRRFQYSAEALICKGKLESEGIEVFLRDHHTVDSNPLYSNAVGGVKLFVRKEEAEQANVILSQISPFSFDDNNQLIKCPECGAEQVEMETSIEGVKSLLRVIFLGAFAFFFSRHKYKCNNCKTEFDQ